MAKTLEPREPVPPRLSCLPCLDSDALAAQCQRELRLPREHAVALGRSAVEAIRQGFYLDGKGGYVDWREEVQTALAAKRSLRPKESLPVPDRAPVSETRVQVTNETTLGAAEPLVARGLKPLALNFANGVHPGGGFLSGSLAQEEVLCRSSALYAILEGDPMYAAHAQRPRPDSTDWAIYSPEVPVFRRDEGTPLDAPWPLTILTCAAPYAPAIGQPEAGDLLQPRIHRVLAIARAFGHEALVLGAWGCGAFDNDPVRTARDFRQALEDKFAGAFREVIFAIADWSPERRFLGPFREVFRADET